MKKYLYKFLKYKMKAVWVSLLGLILLFSTGKVFAQSTQTFSTSGTFSWTCPAGVTSIIVECWGAGGGGGGSDGNNNTKGGGGGGGAYAKNASVTVMPGTTYTITIGGGGTAGTTGNGGDGGASTATFGATTVTANGGIHGNGGILGSLLGAGGAGGAAVNWPGGNGATATSSGGGGGGGAAGTSAAGNNGTVTTGGAAKTTPPGGAGGNGTGCGGGANTQGCPGADYGGGGGGTTVKGGAGGAGAGGEIILTWTCPAYAFTSAASATSICANGGTSTVTLLSTSLPSGTYTVTYNTTNPTTTGNTTMTFTAGSPGTGTFTTISLNGSATSLITITNLTSGGTSPGICSSAISANNTANATVYSIITATVGAGFTTCASIANNISITNITSATSPYSVTWDNSAGACSGIANNGSCIVSVSPVTTTTYTATITDANGCSTTKTQTATVNSVTGGTVAADQAFCSSGNPAAFTQTVASTGSGTLTYQWQSSTTDCSSGFSDIGSATSTIYDAPAGLVTTTYYRRVTTSTLNGVACTANSNCITVTISTPPTPADAGSDQTLTACATSTTLAGNTPTNGTGAWSVVTGTATITSPSSPTSVVTGLVPGTSATLRWAISSSGCTSSTDDVVITTVIGTGCWTYCTPTSTGNGYPITNVTFAGINNNASNPTVVYEDFTSSVTPANVGQGLTYPISVSATGSAGTAFYGNVFLDWNNDGDFIDAGEEFQLGTYTTASITYSGNIAVPSGAVPGITRMRVMHKYASYSTACFSGGNNLQVEDYFVNIFECPPITINQQPTNQLQCSGQNVDFVFDVSCTSSCTYAWKYNGSLVVNGTPAGAVYAGANTSTLNVSGAIAAGTYGTYTCYVANFCRNVTSNTVSLSVSASTPPITPFDPTSGTYGCSVLLTATGSAPAGETWYWQGTSCGTNIALGSGATYTATVSDYYYIRAHNNTSGCWSSSCGDIMPPVLDPPSVIVHPTTLNYGCNGTPLTFSIVASGAGLMYQWQENGVNISNGGVYSGATTENLTISNPAGLNGKQYQCVVTGVCSPAATSNAATLNVLSSGLSGIKTVGTGGDYSTLKLAFDDINANSLTGNLELQIISNITDNSEASLNPWNNCGNNAYTVTIYPTGTTRTISGSNAISLITLNGADHVMFDGRLNKTGAPNSLVISNTDLTFAGSVIKFVNDACYNSIQYCTVKGTENLLTNGVINFSTGIITGNDNNTIANSNICDGASTPRVCIYALGSVGKENDNNTISGCNIYNFYKTSSNGYGIYIADGNSKWTISGNSIYQTSSRSNVDFYGIYIVNAAGSEFDIKGNYVGGQAASCGGSALTITDSGYHPWFRGIYVNCSTTGISYVRNNIIKNITYTSAPYSAIDFSFFPIMISAGRSDVTGNTIGDNATGSIALTINANSSYESINMGIYKGGDGSVLNNTIGSISISGTSTYPVRFYGIQILGTLITDALVSGNTVGHASTANSVQCAATPPLNFCGILFGTDGNYATTVSNNIIANITSNSTGIKPWIMGIDNEASGGTQVVIGNTIRNISTVCTNPSANNVASITGISSMNSTTGGHTVSQNTIHSLSSTGAAAVYVFGIICYHAGAATNINSNLIHSFNTTSNTAVQTGIKIYSGPGNFSNNMIRLGINASGASVSSTPLIRGLWQYSTDPCNYYFNSVYIGGTVTAGAINTYAFVRDNVATINIKNNIFYNARTGGTGKNYAIVTNSNTVTSNYNDLFTVVAGANLGSYNAGTTPQTFATWKSGTSQDANSINSDPSFVTPAGTAATVDLHINTGSTAVGVGWFGTGVLVDYDLQQRKTGTNPNGPCIGADENDLPPLAKNAYGIYIPAAQPTGNISDCEIIAVGGTPGGIGYLVAYNPAPNTVSTNYANVGISSFPKITSDNFSCMNTPIDFTTNSGAPNWIMGNGSSPATGTITPISTQYYTLGRKDIIENVKVFKDFVNMTSDSPSPGAILGAPAGAGCPTTYSYSSSVAGTPGLTYSWSSIVPGGCTTTIASPHSSTTDVTFVNVTGSNQIFILLLDITTECCGPLEQVRRYITIYPAPPAPVLAGGPYSLCTGGSQTLNVNPIDPALSYEWYNANSGGTLLGSGASLIVDPVLSGVHTYYCQAINSFGCASARTAAVITGNDAPAPTVPDASICGTGNVTLNVTSPVVNYIYNWYIGSCGGTLLQSGISPSFTATISSTTTFYVQAIPQGCGVSICSAPVATVTTAPGTVVWVGTTIGPNNWFIASNWGDCLPTCATNVSIPSGTPYNPDIGFNATANAACKDINLQSGATLSFSDTKAELDVCGNFTHSGTINSNDKGEVIFMGALAQTYTKTGNGYFNNVLLNNTNANPTLTIASGDMELGSIGNFIFQSGKVITGTNNLIIDYKAITAISGYDIDKYVVGNLRRYVSDTGSYDFPVGNSNAYELATVDITGGNPINYFTVYFSNPLNAIGTGLPLSENSFDYSTILNNGGVAPTTGNAYGGVWTITPNTGTANYDIILNGRNYSNAGTRLTALKRTTTPTGAWTLPGTYISSSNISNVVTCRRNGLSGFSDFAIGTGSASLPVELLSFNATCDNDKVYLNWSTASEINNDYFSVDKTKDLYNWYELGSVPGSGTTNTIHLYNLTDNSPFSGKSYYRLKQVDFNGASKTYDPVLSECIDLETNTFEIINVVSNETRNELTITYNIPEDGKIDLYLMDYLGQRLTDNRNNSTKGLNMITISLNHPLAIGIYMFSIQCKEKVFTQKVFIK